MKHSAFKTLALAALTLFTGALPQAFADPINIPLFPGQSTVIQSTVVTCSAAPFSPATLPFTFFQINQYFASLNDADLYNYALRGVGGCQLVDGRHNDDMACNFYVKVTGNPGTGCVSSDNDSPQGTWSYALSVFRQNLQQGRCFY